MVRVRPHTVGVAVKGGDTYVTRKVQITPETARSMFDRFGVDVKRPHLLLDNATAEANYVEGGRVTWGERTFAIMALQTYRGIGSADHLEALLEEIR